MKYLLNAEYSVTAVNYSEWKMLESQLPQNWKKYGGVILMLIWI